MKKVFLSILCILGMSLLLVGCTKKTSNPDDIYQIDYYFIMNGTFVPQDLELVEQKISEITEEKIKASVKLHPIAAWSYDEKLNLIINSGDKFDICFTSSWTNNYRNKVQKEAYVDITELLPEYAPTLYANVDPSLYEGIKVDGKIYGVINLQILPRTPGLAVEKTTWEAFCAKTGTKESDIKSIADIEPYLAYVKEVVPNAFNIVAPNDPAGLIIDGHFDELFGMTYPGAVSIDDDPSDGLTVVNQFAQPYYHDIFKLAVDWYEKGYISKKVLTEAFDYTKGYCWLLSTWKPGSAGEQTQVAGRDIITFPIGESIMYNSWAVSDINAISATSEDPVKCLKFLELLNTDKDLYNLITFGIEGIHYNKVGENRIEVVENTRYTMATVGWQFSNQFNAYVTRGQEDDVWEQTKVINATAKYSPIMGFTFDGSNVELELTNCYQAYMEYINSFIYGVFLDEDKPVGDRTEFEKQYTKFINKLKIAGSEKIITEMQSQIDAWLQSQK